MLNPIIITYLTIICCPSEIRKLSSDTLPVIVPPIVVASLPVSSDTTIVKASVTSLIPSAARCLEPYC